MPDIKQTNRDKTKRKQRCAGCCCFPKKLKHDDEQVITQDQCMMKEKKKLEPTPIYVENLNEKLKPGSSIILRGLLKPDCKRFAINLLWFRGHQSDIAFHFNPRLALRYIVRNSLIKNSWGEEETTSINKFQFNRNRSFELHIVATEREFLVAIGGIHICAYVYRVPLEKVNRIQVDGPVDIQGIEYKQVEVYPAPLPQNAPFTIPMGSGEDRVADQQLVVPVAATLPDGFKPGWQLEISGRVKLLPSSFYINLQEGHQLWPHPLIPLHLNPRFYTSYGNHMLVRNCWMNGEWGSEERTSGFEFTPGSSFNVAIRKMDTHFSVWVDGTLAGEFQFRSPTDTIDTVYIHGDVQVFSIYLKDHIDDKYFSKSREKVNHIL